MNSRIEFARQATADDFSCDKDGMKHTWKLTGEKVAGVLPEHNRETVICTVCGMKSWRYGCTRIPPSS